jgi:hypothetical protein
MSLKIVDLYYLIKPFIPRPLQLLLRRQIVARKRQTCGDVWPIDRRCAWIPENWAGWPDRKTFAVILTHDVETAKGHGRCYMLMRLEKELGFRSSFNFVPEKYTVSPELRSTLVENGFEIGVHGLYHDGKYYRSRKIFEERAGLINDYLQKWNSCGFRSPSMLHRLDWMHTLRIEYDSSTFDTDPFEPQPEGVRSIFPLWISGKHPGNGFVELPYTLPQDFTLFIIMREPGIEIWKQKLDWIAENGGMVLLNTHPDYIHFGKRGGAEEYAVSHYLNFLQYLKSRHENQYWHVLPREIARFWARTYSPNRPSASTIGNPGTPSRLHRVPA